MSVSCDCCVMSGRGLCDELVTRPEESYRVWCVKVCDREASTKRGGPGPFGLSSHRGGGKLSVELTNVLSFIRIIHHEQLLKLKDCFHLLINH
jgi:hypothetical protein